MQIAVVDARGDPAIRRSGRETDAPARYEATSARARASAPAITNERAMLRWARVTTHDRLPGADPDAQASGA